MIIVVMGVSGSGKTTVGRLLAQQLGWRFVDGDDLHPAANIAKMSHGIPLDDRDRCGWLQAIGSVISNALEQSESLVVACSALKAAYREVLDQPGVEWIYLKGSRDQLWARLAQRQDHFMSPQLLDSQLEALQEPQDALVLTIVDPPQALVEAAIRHLNRLKSAQ
jgi:gluconokinase